MAIEDLKRILLSPALFRLDRSLALRLVPLLYGTGLFAVLIWAIKHLFATFGQNFGNGLWGLLEIIAFGSVALLVLRIACEALLLHFHAHEEAAEVLPEDRVPTTLLEDIGDALHDIAEAVEDEEDDYITPATDPAPYARDPVTGEPAPGALPRKPMMRRTARRTPLPKV
jgi:hypothetical protein